MDWQHPYLLLLFFPAAALLWWFDRHTLRPLGPVRRRMLLAVRAAGVGLVVMALGGPAVYRAGQQHAVIFLMDHSQSQGESGVRQAYDLVRQRLAELPPGTQVGVVSAGQSAVVRSQPSADAALPDPDFSLLAADGNQTDLGRGIALASGLFPAGMSKQLILVGDGEQTRGDLEAAARGAALLHVTIDALPVAGQVQPDVRVVRLTSDKSVSHEGASFELRAEVESSLTGEGRIRLFENGIEVESRPLKLKPGEQRSEVFRRAPEHRNLYTYRVLVDGFKEDSIRSNDEAMALVDVRGRPVLLYVEGEADEAHYLVDAMAKEGIRLHVRTPETFPQTLQELGGYDGLIVSDTPAGKFSEQSMTMVHDYVEKLGGGFCMIGGRNSFGAGGYYRTPIEDILPVKMRAPDKEERFCVALALVIDRSGSMQGPKIETCKSAAIASVDLLSPKDYVGVVAFDSLPRWIVPMASAAGKATIKSQIAMLNAGGGTNIYPAMTAARQALAAVKAQVKHMIVLTDGETEGSGYAELAAQTHNEGVTISTVAVGADADRNLLRAVAAAGGGKYYETYDPAGLTKIFTQDAMLHLGRLIREESFVPKQVERHPMVDGCPLEQAPMLLGYVRTHRKATAQVPLVTDQGDPLLAHWRFGLGKVTAFTSDAKSRWAALWLSGWPAHGQFWAQILRETCRNPQSRLMDLRVEPKGEGQAITVDLLEDAAHYKNAATVGATVYFVASASAGRAMKPVRQFPLEQVGPGRYQGNFTPEEPGIYLVQTRAGSELASAGVVHAVCGEAATGQINRALLARACELTGGRILESAGDRFTVPAVGPHRWVELTPWILRALLLLLLVDVAVRRWENILGIVALVRERIV